MFDEISDFAKSIKDFSNLKSSEQVDFFAYYIVSHKKFDIFQPNEIAEAFSKLRIIPYSNIAKYLKDNSNKAKVKKRVIKFIKNSEGYHLTSPFENELKSRVLISNEPFVKFKIEHNDLEWKPDDIPFLNSKIKKNADFFTKLYFLFYHLENSIRKFLQAKLSSILGSEWEKHLIKDVDLSKALSIRREVNLSEMLPERGDNILYYCMWDDYGKIIRQFPQIFSNPKECDEILAHLNSLYKIRNAIAHNTSTIPKEYQDELTLFLRKYIRIMKSNI